MDLGRCDWRRARGACLVRSPDPARQDAAVVEPGCRAPQGYATCAADVGLGSLAWASTLPAVSSRLCALQVERMVGLWHRRARRHGNTQPGAAILSPEA